jgi:hypothetical protein
MLIDTHEARLRLDEGFHARLEDARNARLTSIEGVAWITVDGDLHDYFIRPGDSFVVPSDTRVVVDPIRGPALLQIEGDVGAVHRVGAPRSGRLQGWRARLRRRGRE